MRNHNLINGVPPTSEYATLDFFGSWHSSVGYPPSRHTGIGTHIIKRNTHQNGTLILSKGILIKMEHSSLKGTLILSKGILIKMEPSYYQKEYSSKWNTHIIKRITGEKVERINETDLVVFQPRPNNCITSCWARPLGLLLLPLAKWNSHH